MDKLINYEGLSAFHENLINDSSISEKSTWSSDKISTHLAGKADIADLNSYATITYVSSALSTKANTSDLNTYATLNYVNSSLALKQNVLTAGNNVNITNNVVNTNGYVWDASKYSFATNYKSGSGIYQNYAIGENSHAEGDSTSANGGGSHAEGHSTQASGRDSHAEGVGTNTNNPSEHAQGSFNKSHQTNNNWGDGGNTIHSIGIGLLGAMKNAFEVMQNGDTYLYGVGGYDGVHIKNEDPSINVQTLQEYILSLEARIYALEHPTTVE